MTPEQREKLSRWIEAYLDGRLTPEQLAQFNELVKRTPSIRKEIELQTNIDESLKRLFSPPSAQVSAGVQTQADDDAELRIPIETPAPRRPLVSRGAWRLTAAACVLIAVGFGGYAAYLYYGGFDDSGGEPRRYSPAQAYRLAEAGAFEPNWVCKDEQEFATTFHWQLGQAVALAKPPADVVPTGLSYVRLENGKAWNQVEVIAKVNGKGVIVIVDKLNDSIQPCAPMEDGLHVFVKQTPHLVMREITPFDSPKLLELLSEREIPAEWKRTPPGYREGKRPAPPRIKNPELNGEHALPTTGDSTGDGETAPRETDTP